METRCGQWKAGPVEGVSLYPPGNGQEDSTEFGSHRAVSWGQMEWRRRVGILQVGATRSRNLLRCSEAPDGDRHLGSRSCHGNRKTGAANANGFFKENGDAVTMLTVVGREVSMRTVMFRVDTSVLGGLASKPFSISEEPPITCFLMEGRAHIC